MDNGTYPQVVPFCILLFYLDDWHVLMLIFPLIRPKPFYEGWGRLTEGKKSAVWNGQDHFFSGDCLHDFAFLWIWNPHLTQKETELVFFIPIPPLESKVFFSSSKLTVNVIITRSVAISEYPGLHKARKLAIQTKDKAKNLILLVPEKTQWRSREASQGDWVLLSKEGREKNTLNICV